FGVNGERDFWRRKVVVRRRLLGRLQERLVAEQRSSVSACMVGTGEEFASDC
ncbi:unnamed protein product, partial [Urochloa humidicola]